MKKHNQDSFYALFGSRVILLFSGIIGVGISHSTGTVMILGLPLVSQCKVDSFGIFILRDLVEVVNEFICTITTGEFAIGPIFLFLMAVMFILMVIYGLKIGAVKLR